METLRPVPTKYLENWSQRSMDIRGWVHEYVRKIRALIHATNNPYLAENYCRKFTFEG
jgi:hypothetical protein